MNNILKYRIMATWPQMKLLKEHMFSVSQASNILLALKYEENEKNKSLKKNIYLSNEDLDKKVLLKIKQQKLVYDSKLLKQERVRFLYNYFSTLEKYKHSIENLAFVKYAKNGYQSFQFGCEQYKLKDGKAKNGSNIKILSILGQNFELDCKNDIPFGFRIPSIIFDGISFFIVLKYLKESDLINYGKSEPI